MREIPVHSRPRRLVDWINPTGAKKVHSLIDKVISAEEFGDSLGEGASQPGQWGCRWAESGGIRVATGSAVGWFAARAERGHLSAPTGAAAPPPEERQARRVSH